MLVYNIMQYVVTRSNCVLFDSSAEHCPDLGQYNFTTDKIDIEFKFSYKSREKQLRFRSVNILLLLVELNEFLSLVLMGEDATWAYALGPIAHGKILDDRVVISSRSDQQFKNCVYDSMSNWEAAVLQRTTRRQAGWIRSNLLKDADDNQTR